MRFPLERNYRESEDDPAVVEAAHIVELTLSLNPRHATGGKW